jgi:transposase-like protein
VKRWHRTLVQEAPSPDSTAPTIRAAARALGLDEGTVRRWWRRGWWDWIRGEVPLLLLWQVAQDNRCLESMATHELHKLCLARLQAHRIEVMRQEGELVHREAVVDAWTIAAAKAAASAEAMGLDRQTVFHLLIQAGEDFCCGNQLRS